MDDLRMIVMIRRNEGRCLLSTYGFVSDDSEETN